MNKKFKLEENGEDFWKENYSYYEIYELLLNNNKKYYFLTYKDFDYKSTMLYENCDKINSKLEIEFIPVYKLCRFKKKLKVVNINKKSILAISPLGFGFPDFTIKNNIKFIKWYKKNYECIYMNKGENGKFSNLIPIPYGKPFKLIEKDKKNKK